MSEKPKTYDDAFKLLASQDAEALLLLLGELQPGEKAEITPLERELRISTKLPDQPYRVVSARGARIVHVEAESWWKNVMPSRMADYGAREWMVYGLPVDCFVLLLTDRGLPKNPARQRVLMPETSKSLCNFGSFGFPKFQPHKSSSCAATICCRSFR